MTTKVLSNDYETQDLVQILSLTKKLKLSPLPKDSSDLSEQKTILNPNFTQSEREKFKNIFPSVSQETAENHISISNGSVEETVEKYRKYFQQVKLKTSYNHNTFLNRKRNFNESKRNNNSVEAIADKMVSFKTKRELREYLVQLLYGMKEKLIQKKKFVEFASIAKGLNDKIAGYRKTLGVVSKCLEQEKAKNEKLKREIKEKEKEKKELTYSIVTEMREADKYKEILDRLALY